MTKEDLQIIKALKPFIMERLDQIVDRFYKNIGTESSLVDIINQHSTIDRLKITLRRHITEMFTGVIDEKFFQKRIQIAMIHVKIGLKSKWYMSAFEDLLLSFLDVIEDINLSKKDYFLAVRAITKLINLEEQLVLEAFDKEVERKLHESIQEERNEIRENVGSASQYLAAISSNQMHRLTK